MIRTNAPTRVFDIDSDVVSFTTDTDIGAATLETLTARVHDEFSSRDEQTFRNKLASDKTVWTQDLILSFGPEAETISAYTDLHYGLSDRLTRSAWLRFQGFRDRRDIATTALFSPLLPPTTGAASSRKSEFEVLPSLGIGYEIDDKNSVSLSLRRGYTPGGSEHARALIHDSDARV
ncbi:TonB-dependent receptor [uncultured Roseovarius sp.]|uniref:TonB-dependent receptor n=1 Tax=uncultured Roseovarius sp. TaxID=293344 RepID=UPI00261F8104|nr:TonB-dependent receptor [uncultured Roseovarius sp.]